MSLRDELPVNTGVSFCSVKTEENEATARQVADFLSKGGKIEVLPAGFGKDTIGFNKGADIKKQAEIQAEFLRAKSPVFSTVKKDICEAENKAKRKGSPKPIMRPENRAKSGRMNIHKTANGKWVVTVRSMHVGTYENEPAAISARDDERRRLGLPDADY